MPALNGQSISTLRDGAGNTVVAIVISWNVADGALRDATYTTVQDGVKTGAVIADNPTTKAVTMRLTDDAGGNSRTINIPAHGRALTVAQLAALPSPITTHDDLNGFTFDLA
jgi:hypothetical protein